MHHSFRCTTKTKQTAPKNSPRYNAIMTTAPLPAKLSESHPQRQSKPPDRHADAEQKMCHDPDFRRKFRIMTHPDAEKANFFNRLIPPTRNFGGFEPVRGCTMCHDPEKQPNIRIVLHIRGCGNTNSAPAIKTSTIHRSKKHTKTQPATNATITDAPTSSQTSAAHHNRDPHSQLKEWNEAAHHDQKSQQCRLRVKEPASTPIPYAYSHQQKDAA